MPVDLPQDLRLTESLVVQLVAEQSPDLASLPVTLLKYGWDNAVFNLGDDLLVRLPHCERAVSRVLAEQQWLPRLAPHLVAATPEPVFCGRPSELFDRPWSIVPRLHDRSLLEVPLAERQQVAGSLAEFFAALHTVAPPDAPSNHLRGTPLVRLHPRVRILFAATPGFGARALATWRRWAASPAYTDAPRWVHGDIQPAHLLIDSQGLLSGVLDWGDLSSGDPASDLAIAWLGFDELGRARFIDRCEAIGRYDQHIWTRARAWALGLAATLVHYAEGDPNRAAVGRRVANELLR